MGATNFTIKNAANADTVFTAVASAAGNLPSVWYVRSMGTAPAFQPKLQLSTKGRPNQGRDVEMTFAVPVTATAPDGTVKVVDTDFYKVTKVAPGRIPATVQTDSSTLLANILDVPQIRDAFATGFAG